LYYSWIWLARSSVDKSKMPHPADFGQIERKCICEIPGQIPCPAKVPIPKALRSSHNKESTN
jgi:small subunit ribosomal protein S25